MSTHIRPGDTGLVGRAREQERLAALLSGLSAGPSGGPRVLHLVGDTGTGKTSLLEFAAAAAAAQGTDVLSTAWAPSERGLRHAALHRLLHPRLSRLGELPHTDRSLLQEAFGGCAAQPAPAELAAAAMRLLTAAPGPVLLCVDDLDRLDPASRDTVREMTLLCGRTRVGMVLARHAAPDARPAPDALTLTLGPLPEPEARRLVARSARATGHTEQELVLAVARGNPIALTELALDDGAFGDTAGIGMLPATPRLAQAHEAELEDLPAAARDVLLTAALSVTSDVRDVLAAGTRLLGSADAARVGLDEAVTRGLVVEDGPRLRFPRPLLRLAVLRLEPAARRMAAHDALGRCVTSRPHAAWHAAQCTAGAHEDLARSLECLADEPAAGPAVLTALAALETAGRLAGSPEHRARRLLRAAELACDHGLWEQARRHARGIDPAELGEFGHALLLWVHDLLPGNSAVGRERVAELCASARAVAAAHPALAGKLLHAAARRCWWQQSPAGERRTVALAFEDLRPEPWDARDLTVKALLDPRSVNREALRRTPRPLGRDDRALLGQAAFLAGDLDLAASLLGEAETEVRAEGRYGQLPQILVPKTLTELWLGTGWRTAEATAEEARTTAARTGQTGWVARAAGAQGVFAALRGRHDTALACATAVEEASLHLGQSRQLHLASLARALTASGTGRYAEAYARLHAMCTETAAPYAFEQLWGLAFLVEAAPPAGERADARTLVEHFESRTASMRDPLLGRILTYARAVLAPDEEAEARFRSALEPGVETWPLLHAMTCFGQGAWLRRRRRVTESREPLAAAESLFRALGADTRADLAASELRATGRAAGETPGDDEASRLLSPQQLTIARLAARGLSNRAIGEQLRLSPRTVASHLYQIFPKLNVTSRAQLAAKLGDN